jgi:hypothetical protein
VLWCPYRSIATAGGELPVLVSWYLNRIRDKDLQFYSRIMKIKNPLQILKRIFYERMPFNKRVGHH